MSLTGKTISELPLLTGFSENISIPVEISGVTYQTTPSTLQSSRVWNALITQTGPLTFTGGTDTPTGGFIFNETYTIDDYAAGDDFSNVAQVISGNINETGCVFIATGDTTTLQLFPNVWNGSTLTSFGGVISNVLENTLGFNIVIDYPAFGIDGLMFFNSDSLTETTFNTQKTKVTANVSIPFDFAPVLPVFLTSVDADLLTPVLFIIDPQTGSPTGGLLYNTPIEIKVYN
jgi:hypothetical protein